MILKKKAFLVCLAVLLSGCAGTAPVETSKKAAPLNLKQSNFQNLPGWDQENFQSLGQAYNRSCGRILKKDSQSLFGANDRFGKMQEWQIACRQFAKINQNNAGDIRRFFEQNFIPYSAMAGSDPEGLFTGYYEAGLRGSKTKKGKYIYPLRARPDDLVMVDLGEFREELKGQRIAGRVKGGNLKPYETHGEILAGKLPKDQDKALVWVDSPVDAFFIQIQGSGVVMMDDGSVMRVGYAGQNGHPYYAVGRELVKRGELSKDEVSLQTIRQWMETHPDQAQELMITNKSYVFFRQLEGEGPEGGEGIALTPTRSLAIDRSIIPYGMPVWLSAENPVRGQAPINRLMVTQDTGGAIQGPVRGDFFWGYGAQAERMAGPMKSKGRYWFLLPKKL
ncbi:MAG TPA: murein transglycosylase A [Alphaproteobacteria bacterium]|nr:murein transglycosylase A [Alphaproteobacteria bacterium]